VKPYIVVCDIDGTLADCKHRRPHLDEKPRNWKAFNEKMGEDTPVTALVALLQQLSVVSHMCEVNAIFHGCEPAWKNTILIVSAREEAFRPVTESWLLHHGIPYHELLMRPLADYRDDQHIKQEILTDIITRYGKPDIVFEDRDRLVKMWRDADILCCQVDYGDF